MAVGVFIRSDKVLLKGKDLLFSQVRQTFCQRLLSASRAFAAYLLPALPRHCLCRAAGGEGGVAESLVPSDGEAQWKAPPPPGLRELGKGIERDAPGMGSQGAWEPGELWRPLH